MFSFLSRGWRGKGGARDEESSDPIAQRQSSIDKPFTSDPSTSTSPNQQTRSQRRVLRAPSSTSSSGTGTGTHALSISAPIPRMGPGSGSLNGVEVYPLASPASASSTASRSASQTRASSTAGATGTGDYQFPPTSSSSAPLVSWLQDVDTRRGVQRKALGEASGTGRTGTYANAYAPPEVVRVSTNDTYVEMEENEENEGEQLVAMAGVEDPRLRIYSDPAASKSTHSVSTTTVASRAAPRMQSQAQETIIVPNPQSSRPLRSGYGGYPLPTHDEHDQEHDHDYHYNQHDSSLDSDSSEDMHSAHFAFPIPPSTIPQPKPNQKPANLKLHLPFSGTFSKTGSVGSGSGSGAPGQYTRPGSDAGSTASSGSFNTAPSTHVATSEYTTNSAYLYKQLSPIPEQDYTSPASASTKPTSRLPFGSGSAESKNASMNSLAISPGGQSVFRLASVPPLKGPGPGHGTAFAGGHEGVFGNSGGNFSYYGPYSEQPAFGGEGFMDSGMSPSQGSIKVQLNRAGSIGKEPQACSPGVPDVVFRATPGSPFLTRQLNRTVSQTSSKSDSQNQPQVPASAGAIGARKPPSRQSTGGSMPSAQVPSRSNTLEIAVQTPTTAGTTTTESMYITPISAVSAQSPAVSSSSSGTIHAASYSTKIGSQTPVIPPLNFQPSFPGPNPFPTHHPSLSPRQAGVAVSRPPKVYVALASNGRRKYPGVDRMPVIEGSTDGHHYGDEVYDEEEEEEEAEESEEYELSSLHAESFVTAGSSNAHGRAIEGAGGRVLGSVPPLPSGVDVPVRYSQPPSTTGADSFIARRWERAVEMSSSPMVSPTRLRTKNHHRVWSVTESDWTTSLSPAMWSFWLGFFFPVLWLIGGWHFSNCGEQPPKYTFWEWYFWSRRWRWSLLKQRVRRAFGCMTEEELDEESRVTPMPQKRRHRKTNSTSNSSSRTGKVYPPLPRWVAEKQSTDDGRAKLNDMKRSLKGISFGYPFVSRLPDSQVSSAAGSQHQSSKSTIWNILCLPNRALDQLYGVKITEICGRPESGRRMIDPWIQRCRYALCYALMLLAAGLCTASAYLIIRNTRQL